jgi:hypothetical protein
MSWWTIDSARMTDGSQMTLARRGDEHSIRIDGVPPHVREQIFEASLRGRHSSRSCLCHREKSLLGQRLTPRAHL